MKLYILVHVVGIYVIWSYRLLRSKDVLDTVVVKGRLSKLGQARDFGEPRMCCNALSKTVISV